MTECRSIDQLRQQISTWKAQGESIALVPTMGNLHEGHLHLVKIAQQHAQHVVVSIFVNPMQFNNSNDLDNYPRTQAADLQKLAALNVDIAFLPSPEMMYPNGVELETKVNVTGLDSVLEGAHRPGHFQGVATVVSKFFNLVQPDFAIFGEKDYQQLALIRKMASDLMLATEIIGVETQRDKEGLALSSRNTRLSPEQLELAPNLAKVMANVAQNCLKPNANLSDISQQAASTLNAQGFETDAIDIVDADTLAPVSPTTARIVILMAAFLGEVRLIDNLCVHLDPQ
ncbi:pantoate--beta-alanine ligase [Alginatibacterium sediminis]|uniref:Pantothenate synthetase n=1 Tax=Alginatibacterium sediminis TaxID=2164068 RepID=A0A420E8Z7_9ALTE|nr:pantoate--beta-alanine ligase [Alginatibacterium sediminis]RKF15857.1 pantoate--beta-alanine ligase [Alginatibacterium sediminis]